MKTEKKRNTYVWCEKARRYILEVPAPKKEKKVAPKKKAAKKDVK